MPMTPDGASGPTRFTRVRLDAARRVGADWLEELERVEAARHAAGPLVLLQVDGDAPLLESGRLAAGERDRLWRWGRRVAAPPGGRLCIGWGGGLLRGPALEWVLSADVLLLGPGARLLFFPPEEGYLPVAGGLSRLARRAGAARALPACLEGRPVDAAEAVRLGVAAAVLREEERERWMEDLAGRDDRALSAVGALVRGGDGGARTAEVLERALFSWCFAGGRPPQAIRDFRGQARGRTRPR